MLGLIGNAKQGQSYYDAGVEFVSIINGQADGVYSRSKEADHLLLNCGSADAIADVAYVTDVTIDFTRIRTLYVEWENTGDTSNENRSFFNVSSEQLGTYAVYNARRYLNNLFTRQISSLDVANLIGNYYIRFHARTNAINVSSILKIYRIWGEE